MTASRRAGVRAGLLLLGALGAMAQGCWVTSSEYDRGRSRLEARMHELENRDQQRRQQLQEAVDQATSQVRTLNEQLEQARTQTRNMADIGVRLDDLETRIRTLTGTLDELRHSLDEATSARSQVANRVEAVERRLGIAPLVDANQIPADNGQLLALARTAFEARDYPRTRFLAQALVQRAAQDPNADDAMLLIARAQLAENRAATAVQELNRLLQTYPQGDAVPEALGVLADSFVNLRMCTEAQRTLRLLIERHGRTPAAAAARTRLEAVRALPREACGG
jgi:TolA-binding protein